MWTPDRTLVRATAAVLAPGVFASELEIATAVASELEIRVTGARNEERGGYREEGKKEGHSP